MMYQKDYILRMIEMLGELLAAIFGLIKKGNYDQASKSLDRAYYNLLKEDASFFQRISKDKLTEKLIREHNYTHSHLEILAELFYAEAELQYAKGNQDKSIKFYEKSFILFEFIAKKSKSFSFERQSKQSLIKERIAQIKG